MSNDKRVDYILKYTENNKALHVGCADWPYTKRRIHNNELLHVKLDKAAKELVGIDISDEGISALRDLKANYRVYHIEDKSSYLDEDYDVIIATEVIEHVLNQGDFLNALNEASSKNTLLIITTPNAYSLKGSLRAFINKEYQHPDHVLLHSTKTITHLLNNYGWEIKDFDYYSPPSKSLLSKFMNFNISLLEKLFSRRIQDGIMLVAKRKI